MHIIVMEDRNDKYIYMHIYIDSDGEIENLLCFFMFQWGGLSCPILTQKATCIVAWEVPPFLHIQQPCASGKGKL